MTDYLVSARAEVLHERANDVLAKYETYLSTNKAPLDCIKQIYENFCLYAKKIVLCNSQEEYETLENNVNEYEKIIDNTNYSFSIGA